MTSLLIALSLFTSAAPAHAQVLATEPWGNG